MSSFHFWVTFLYLDGICYNKPPPWGCSPLEDRCAPPNPVLTRGRTNTAKQVASSVRQRPSVTHSSTQVFSPSGGARVRVCDRLPPWWDRFNSVHLKPSAQQSTNSQSNVSDRKRKNTRIIPRLPNIFWPVETHNNTTNRRGLLLLSINILLFFLSCPQINCIIPSVYLYLLNSIEDKRN